MDAYWIELAHDRLPCQTSWNTLWSAWVPHKEENARLAWQPSVSQTLLGPFHGFKYVVVIVQYSHFFSPAECGTCKAADK